MASALGLVVGAAVTALGHLGSAGRDTAFATVARQSTGPGGKPLTGVTGVHGLFPGGPSVAVEFEVRNPGATRLSVQSLVQVPDSFSAACPPTVWKIDPPMALPSIPAHQTTIVVVQVALKAHALDACRWAASRISMTAVGSPV
ncbi:MAG TPA: hypothetical protein VHN80_12830 [Kineosporiaceae bacterium]|nr:hypothetical protein [Kineosporiaceae bacterium]